MSVMKALLNEKSNQSVEEFKQNVITEGVRIFESGVESPFKMSSLKEDAQLQSLFESTNEKDQKRAALTCIALENQAAWLTGVIKNYGEATVMGSLGALTPKIMDVVR